MKGNNQLILNKAVLIQAVQFFFEKQVFTKTEMPYVKDILEDKVNDVFIVKVSEEDSEEE